MCYLLRLKKGRVKRAEYEILARWISKRKEAF
jgi:hypothetical protein